MLLMQAFKQVILALKKPSSCWYTYFESVTTYHNNHCYDNHIHLTMFYAAKHAAEYHLNVKVGVYLVKKFRNKFYMNS